MTSKYAQVAEGKVQNIAVFDNHVDATRITRAIYGEESEAINVDNIDVHINAMYRAGTFYNILDDGTEKEAEHIPTESERLSRLTSQQDEITLAIAALIGG